MDTRVTKKKLGLKERYAAMTRGLGWETSYQPMDKVFPYDRYEGIKIHDWDQWEDPFRLTMDAYWKYQGEKEKKLYAVIEAFAQNNGQLGVADPRAGQRRQLRGEELRPAGVVAQDSAEASAGAPGPSPPSLRRFPYRRSKRSMRPPVSTSFCLPV